jgi:hypothetical protein
MSVFKGLTEQSDGRLHLNCDSTRAENRFRLRAKGTSPFKSARASFQLTTGRRAVHISLQGLYCSCKPVFCCLVTLTGYPLHSIVSPLLLFPCVTACHHISTGLYLVIIKKARRINNRSFRICLIQGKISEKQINCVKR